MTLRFLDFCNKSRFRFLSSAFRHAPVSLIVVAMGGMGLFSCSGQQERSSSLSEELAGHWMLAENEKDSSSNQLGTTVHGTLSFNGEAAVGQEGRSAVFDGRSVWLEVAPDDRSSLGEGDFSVAAWLYTDTEDFSGDIMSQYSLDSKKGFQLSLKSNASPTSQSGYRQVLFGIDDNKSIPWKDEGRPGNALLAFGMAEYKGELYAGVCQPGKDDSGKVFRYKGKEEWVDCGAPDKSNTVTALAVFDGELYAATGHYRVAGSSLAESENTEPGGRIFRYEEPGKWVPAGQLPGVSCIGGLVVYQGKLYASSMYAPSGFFRYDGGDNWTELPNPDGKRVVNMAVHDGFLFATSWDHGHVYRFDGEKWENCGLVGDNTQNYAFNIYQGNLYTATWPSGRVFRFDGLDNWTDVGRLGNELEVMAMMTYNGQMLGGTLPLAEVYAYRGDTLWTRMEQLDTTPDVKYRRAWTMAEHDGRVFCSTLPSGKIFSYESGKSVAAPESLGEGWQHITAVKTSRALKLYINGVMVAEKTIPENLKFDLSSDESIKIGFGANDYLSGSLKDVRLYKRELKEKEIRELSR